MPDTIIAFLCPNCGAEVDALDGYTNIKCDYCGSKLLITQRIGVPRVFAKPELRNPRKFLRSIIDGEIEIIDSDLLFIPLIKVRGEIIGWIKGYKKGEVKKNYHHGSGSHDTYSPPRIEGEKRVKKRIRRIQEVKIDPSEFYLFGINRVNIKGKKFESYNDNVMHRYGNVFDLPLSTEEYLEIGEEKLINNIVSYYRNWDRFQHNLRVIGRRAIIYYNPVFFVRLEVDGIPYTYSIDAVNKDVILRDELVDTRNYKKTLNTKLLYGLIGGTGILISIVSHLAGILPAFLLGVFSFFGIWWFQHGN